MLRCEVWQRFIKPKCSLYRCKQADKIKDMRLVGLVTRAVTIRISNKIFAG
jgi:hypothetical protein